VKLRSAIVALVALALPLAACGSGTATHPIAGLQRDPAPVVGDLSLPEASNGDTDFAFKADAGKFLIVYFGYTSCPDVCPTTLSEVKKALAQIGDKAKNVEVAMITVDPTRDTAELLTKYVHTFVKDSHALRTEDDSVLQKVAKGFGSGYSVTTNAKGEVEVTHSGNLFVVDPAGTVVLEWPFGLKAKAFANDLETLFGKA
jgi:protein SCO1/2